MCGNLSPVEVYNLNHYIKVTIKEKDNTVGGKLATKPVEILGQTFYIETGFHAWFYNYFQFKDIRDRLKINQNFRKWLKVNFVFRDYKPESVYSHGPYPFNLLGVVLRSANLNMIHAITSFFGNKINK